MDSYQNIRSFKPQYPQILFPAAAPNCSKIRIKNESTRLFQHVLECLSTLYQMFPTLSAFKASQNLYFSFRLIHNLVTFIFSSFYFIVWCCSVLYLYITGLYCIILSFVHVFFFFFQDEAIKCVVHHFGQIDHFKALSCI